MYGQYRQLPVQSSRQRGILLYPYRLGAGDSVPTIGELAVYQIESLITAYAEKNDKNTFMQKLLLGNYTEVEAFNQAKKTACQLHLQPGGLSCGNPPEKDEHALATIKNIFSARTKDFITSIDDTGSSWYMSFLPPKQKKIWKTSRLCWLTCWEQKP